jgi:hypothetical protein
MARVDGIIAKLNAVLTRVNASDRDVYIRRTTQSGGDALTGRGMLVNKRDSLLSPVPAVVVASKQYPLVIAGQALSPDAEYLVTVSATAMARADVTDPTVSIVFKTQSNPVQEEELFICGFQASYFQGTDIAFSLVLCSKER